MRFISYLFLGRAGQVEDVWIDSLGVTIGICILLLLVKIVEKINKKRKDA